MSIPANPLVSVIIACYNAEKYIDACLASIVNQTYSNLEIIVCDDASTDGSLKKLHEWKDKDNRIIVLSNKTNMFSAATRNRCIEVSHGEFLMIQDVDDISKLDRAEKLLKTFSDHPDMSIISSSFDCFIQDPNVIIKTYKTNNKFPTKYSFMRGMPFSHPASMIKRKCVLDVSGYRIAKETRRCQDYDMFMRMYAKGHRAMVIDEALYLYRLDEANYRRRTFAARVGEYKIRLNGYREMGIMPWAYPYALKPFLAYFVQYIKNSIRRRVK